VRNIHYEIWRSERLVAEALRQFVVALQAVVNNRADSFLAMRLDRVDFALTVVNDFAIAKLPGNVLDLKGNASRIHDLQR